MMTTFMNQAFPPLRRIAARCGRLAPLLVLALLGACQRAPQPPGPQDLQRADAARPADPQLAQKYERSCQTCHAVQGSTAPLTAFAPDWAPRLQQGMATLLAHAREGYKAMPPKGFCNDCSDAELSALIRFMSSTPEGT